MKKARFSCMKFQDVFRKTGSVESVFGNPPILETDRMIIRKIHLKDARDIYSWSSDPRVARYVLWEPHKSVHETKAYIRMIRSAYRQGLPSSWVIEYKETGHVIGTIGIMSYHPQYQYAEIGYSLSPAYWNLGLMTEALSRMIRFCFDDLCLQRVEALHDIRNPASGRVMEKCGMNMEGILRKRILNKGEFIDVAIYAILNPVVSRS